MRLCVLRCDRWPWRATSLLLAVVALLALMRDASLSHGALRQRLATADALSRQAAQWLSSTPPQPELAARAAIAAHRTYPSLASDAAMRQALDELTSSAHVAQEGAVLAVVVAPEGRWVATGGADSMLRFWLLAPSGSLADPGQPAPPLPHSHWIVSLAISPDGRWLASASLDGRVRLWRLIYDAGIVIPELRPALELAHSAQALRVAFSPDSRWLASASTDCTARLLRIREDGETWDEVAMLPHDIWVEDVRFSPDGRWLASASGGVMRLWGLPAAGELPVTEPVLATPPRHLLWKMAFTPDARFFVAGGVTGGVHLWALSPSGRGPWTQAGDMRIGAIVTALDVSPDGEWVAVGDNAGSISFWPMDMAAWQRGHEPRPSLHVESAIGASELRFALDGLFLLGRADKTVHVWGPVPALQRGESLQELARLEHAAPVTAMALSAEGRWLLTGTQTGQIRAWRWRTHDVAAAICERLADNQSIRECRGFR